MKLNKVFTALVILLPFLYQYKSPISVISFGEFILIPFILFGLYEKLKCRTKSKSYNGLYIYISIAILFNFIASLQSFYKYSDFITVFARIIYYGMLIYVAYDYFEFEFGIKFLIITSLFFSIYAIMQYFTYNITGKILPTVINANLVFSGEESGKRLDYENYYRWLYRASSLFLEPGYFVSYAAPALIALLHYKKTNSRNIILAIIITLGFIVSASSASLIVLMISWGAWIINIRKKNGKKIKIRDITIILCIIILSIYIFNSSIAKTVLNRTSSGGSFDNRITRSYILLKNTNSFQKIVGVGINNVANFVESNQIYTQYDENDLGYVSSYIGTIIMSGIITFYFYNRFFIISFFKNKQMYTRVLIIVFLFYNIIGNVVFTSKFAVYTILILAAQKYFKENDKEEKDENI